MSFLLEKMAGSMKQALPSMGYESQSPRYMKKQLLLWCMQLDQEHIETIIELVKSVLGNGMTSVLNGIS